MVIMATIAFLILAVIQGVLGFAVIVGTIGLILKAIFFLFVIGLIISADVMPLRNNET